MTKYLKILSLNILYNFCHKYESQFTLLSEENTIIPIFSKKLLKFEISK